VRADRRGLALCVVSAAGFGAMAILAKDAYAAGLGVLTLLALRFALATALLWAVALARGTARLPRRALLAALTLGAVGYTLQSSAFFAALERIDASLTALLLYAYPSLVALGAIALGRERLSTGKLAALALASVGTAAVLLGGGTGGLDGLGVALALGAAVAYAIYILVADVALRGADPFAAAAAVTTGAGVSFAVAAVVAGKLDLGFDSTGWLDVAGIAVISTVVPITTFLLGLARIGAASASIVSTVEPVVTVALAFALLGERLHAAQALGGALVLGALVVLQRAALRGAPALA
jgi:drug/metabolite transporter (DMT)-like permease